MIRGSYQYPESSIEINQQNEVPMIPAQSLHNQIFVPINPGAQYGPPIYTGHPFYTTANIPPPSPEYQQNQSIIEDTLHSRLNVDAPEFVPKATVSEHEGNEFVPKATISEHGGTTVWNTHSPPKIPPIPSSYIIFDQNSTILRPNQSECPSHSPPNVPVKIPPIPSSYIIFDQNSTILRPNQSECPSNVPVELPPIPSSYIIFDQNSTILRSSQPEFPPNIEFLQDDEVLYQENQNFQRNDTILQPQEPDFVPEVFLQDSGTVNLADQDETKYYGNYKDNQRQGYQNRPERTYNKTNRRDSTRNWSNQDTFGNENWKTREKQRFSRGTPNFENTDQIELRQERNVNTDQERHRNIWDDRSNRRGFSRGRESVEHQKELRQERNNTDQEDSRTENNWENRTNRRSFTRGRGSFEYHKDPRYERTSDVNKEGFKPRKNWENGPPNRRVYSKPQETVENSDQEKSNNTNKDRFRHERRWETDSTNQRGYSKGRERLENPDQKEGRWERNSYNRYSRNENKLENGHERYRYPKEQTPRQNRDHEGDGFSENTGNKDIPAEDTQDKTYPTDHQTEFTSRRNQNRDGSDYNNFRQRGRFSKSFQDDPDVRNKESRNKEKFVNKRTQFAKESKENKSEESNVSDNSKSENQTELRNKERKSAPLKENKETQPEEQVENSWIEEDDDYKRKRTGSDSLESVGSSFLEDQKENKWKKNPGKLTRELRENEIAKSLEGSSWEFRKQKPKRRNFEDKKPHREETISEIIEEKKKHGGLNIERETTGETKTAQNPHEHKFRRSSLGRDETKIEDLFHKDFENAKSLEGSTWEFKKQKPKWRNFEDKKPYREETINEIIEEKKKHGGLNIERETTGETKTAQNPHEHKFRRSSLGKDETKIEDLFHKDFENAKSLEGSTWEFKKQKPKWRNFEDKKPYREETISEIIQEKKKYRDLKIEREATGETKTAQNPYEDKFRRSSLGKDETKIEDLFDKDYEHQDEEYKEFLTELSNSVNYEPVKIKESEQDLFDVPDSYSLAHCVAEDFRMGSGIAVDFKKRFKSTEELLMQRRRAGGLAILNQPPRFIYYLVTKKRSHHKPTYKDFWCSIKALRDHIKKNSVKQLAIPKLGCGLDRLDWSTVKHIIEFLFKNVNIEILYCKFIYNEDTPQKDSNAVSIYDWNEKLVDIQEKSVIIYFTTADGTVTDEMKELDEKYKIVEEFEKSQKSLGVVVQRETDPHLLCGCIARKNAKMLFDFKSFKKCVEELNRITKDSEYTGIAMNFVNDDRDKFLHHKIITMLVHYLKYTDVYVYKEGGDVSLVGT